MPTETKHTDRQTRGGFTIVVDPAEIVTALANRHEYPDRDGDEVITVRPPFEGERRGEHRFVEAGSSWPSDMTPKPLDLPPDQFLNDRKRRASYPTRSVVYALMSVEDVEPTEENKREWYDEWADVWESDVRGALRDQIDINEFDCGSTEHVAIRYRSPDADVGDQ